MVYIKYSNLMWSIWHIRVSLGNKKYISQLYKCTFFSKRSDTSITFLQHSHNIFTTLSQQIINGKFLLVPI